MSRLVFKHKYTPDDIKLIDSWCLKYGLDLLVCYYPTRDAPSVEYKYCHTVGEAVKTLDKIKGKFIPKGGYAEILAVKNNSRLTVFYYDDKTKAFYINMLKSIRQEMKRNA